MSADATEHRAAKDLYLGRYVRFTTQKAYGMPVWRYGTVVGGMDGKVVVSHNGIDFIVSSSSVEHADA